MFQLMNMKYGNKIKETLCEEHETVNKYDVNSQLIKKDQKISDKVTNIQL